MLFFRLGLLAHMRVRVFVRTSSCWWVMSRLRHQALVRSPGLWEGLTSCHCRGFTASYALGPVDIALMLHSSRCHSKEASAWRQLSVFLMEKAPTGFILPVLSWQSIIAGPLWRGAQLRVRWCRVRSVIAGRMSITVPETGVLLCCVVMGVWKCVGVKSQVRISS